METCTGWRGGHKLMVLKTWTSGLELLLQWQASTKGQAWRPHKDASNYLGMASSSSSAAMPARRPCFLLLLRSLLSGCLSFWASLTCLWRLLEAGECATTRHRPPYWSLAAQIAGCARAPYFLCARVSVCVCMCVYMCLCVWMWMWMWMCASTCACACVRALVCAHACVHLCVYVCMLFIFMYTYERELYLASWDLNHANNLFAASNCASIPSISTKIGF